MPVIGMAAGGISVQFQCVSTVVTVVTHSLIHLLDSQMSMVKCQYKGLTQMGYLGGLPTTTCPGYHYHEQVRGGQMGGKEKPNSLCIMKSHN